MSNLKHQNVEQLKASRLECDKYISKLQSTLNGQLVRMQWIEQYLYEKTPQEMSITEIEAELGHRVIIK